MDLIQKVRQEKRERLSGKVQQEEDAARLALDQLRAKESQFASQIHKIAIPVVQAWLHQNPNSLKNKISNIPSIVYLASILEPDLCASLKEIIMGQEKSCWENLPHSKRRLQKYGGDV